MSKASKKIRLDQALVERGLVESRSKAQALILAGEVLIGTEKITKAGHAVDADAQITLKNKLPYVSRGGFKLEGALKEFNIDIKDHICLDIGASTGGFTDVLLQNHAKKVYCVDVGYGQLHWKLQSDERVVVFDRENFRHFDLSKLTDPVNTVVMDVSFISILKIFPKIVELFNLQKESSKTNHAQQLISLIKPQFEVGKEKIGKGGIVKDEIAKKTVVQNVLQELTNLGFKDMQSCASPIKGTEGNEEFLVFARFI